MRIGIDIDDTIASTNDKLLETAIRYDKEVLGGRGFRDETAYKFVEMFYWDKTNVNNFFTYVRKSNFFLELDVIPGALEYINKLYDEGNEIYFITYRSGKDKRVYEMTKEWLSNKGFKYNKLFMDGSNKGMICKNNQVDLFIDNSYEHIESANMYGIPNILFHTVYNNDIPDVNRKHNWEEIYNYIKEEGIDGKNS